MVTHHEDQRVLEGLPQFFFEKDGPFVVGFPSCRGSDYDETCVTPFVGVP